METIRTYADETTTNLEILIATCQLTPCLRKQIQTAIHIYREIGKQTNPNVADSANSLLALRDEIDNHWGQVFRNSSKTAELFRHMLVFRVFLKGKLLEDYAGGSQVINENIICLSRVMGPLSDRERAARDIGVPLDGLDDIYQQWVIFVLQELLLDRGHIESKMRAALARGGKPGSDIQPLIDRRDWESLATVLMKDQLLTTELLSGADERKVQHGMRKIQKKYFLELISPSRFTLSKHARTLLVKSARPPSNHFFIDPPPYSDHKKDAGRG